MKTSLNINQFLGKNDWIKLQGQNDLKEQLWNSNKEYVFQYIKEHLLNDYDLLFLHEVPFIREIPYPYNGKTNYKRVQKDTAKIVNDDLCKIYLELQDFCLNNNLKIFNPDSSSTAFFQTLAIVRNDKLFSQIKTAQLFKQYSTRVIALKSKTETIVGVHIPIDCKDYWDSLDALHKSFSSDSAKLYLGDFNTYMPGTTNKNRLYKFLSNDLVDLWLETGHSHTHETSDMHTRIDYAFVSGKDYEKHKYEIYSDDIIRKQGYSDHSSIIVL